MASSLRLKVPLRAGQVDMSQQLLQWAPVAASMGWRPMQASAVWGVATAAACYCLQLLKHLPACDWQSI